MLSKRLRNPWLWVFVGWTVAAALVGYFLSRRALVHPLTKEVTWLVDWFTVLAAVVLSWIALAIGVSLAVSAGALVSGADRQLLVVKYLRRKLSPMFAALAVTLCTAMVIIVISVMGGFLQMWRDTAKRLSGDIIIEAGMTGFPRYEKAMEVVGKLPEVEATAAMIKTYGLIKLPNTKHGAFQTTVEKAEIVGINPVQFNKVVPYQDCLYWTAARIKAERAKWRPQDPVTQRRVGQDKYRIMDGNMVIAAMSGKPPPEWNSPYEAMTIGVAMAGTRRDTDGSYILYEAPALAEDATITVVPLTEKGGLLDRAVGKFSIVNEVQSGFIEYDQSRVYVPFDTLQKMLEMQGGLPLADPQGNPTGKLSEARASMVFIRGKEGVDLEHLHQRVQAALKDTPELEIIGLHLRTKTWIQEHGFILTAVENEKGLLVFLFAIISLVALVMVATTFYNFVLEKTRDVGVLRAIGTSRQGVAGLFLGYGLVIGIVGAAAGLGLSVLVVTNLNGIQLFLERSTGATAFIGLFACIGVALAILIRYFTQPAPLVDPPRWRNWLWVVCIAGMGVIGFLILQASPQFAADLQRRLSIKIWDARIYYFETIPTDMNPKEVTVILAFAVLASVLGSLLPALRAARLDPVEAIRYE